MRTGRTAALLAVATVLLYEISGIGHPTPFDYYARLAEAFANGRAWLLDAPSYLNELVRCGPGWCVHLAPLPAAVVLPFLAVFPGPTAQTLASAIAGGSVAGPTYLILRRLGAPGGIAVATTVFAVAGTDLWFSSADGRAWYLSQSVGVLLATVTVLGALSGWRPWIVGAIFGAAVLSRYQLALAAPGVALLLSRTSGRAFVPTAVRMSVGIAPFLVASVFYNTIRFGQPFETGYGPLAAHDAYAEGLFNPVYIPRHIYAIVMQAPEFVDRTWLFVRPSRLGESLLLVSPAFLYVLPSFAHSRRRAEIVPLVMAAVGPLALDLLHAEVGFTQFGYRYWLDAQPFLVPLVAVGAAWSGTEWHPLRRTVVAVIAWCVLANLYGTLAIIQLGYW